MRNMDASVRMFDYIRLSRDVGSQVVIICASIWARHNCILLPTPKHPRTRCKTGDSLASKAIAKHKVHRHVERRRKHCVAAKVSVHASSRCFVMFCLCSCGKTVARCRQQFFLIQLADTVCITCHLFVMVAKLQTISAGHVVIQQDAVSNHVGRNETQWMSSLPLAKCLTC